MELRMFLVIPTLFWLLKLFNVNRPLPPYKLHVFDHPSLFNMSAFVFIIATSLVIILAWYLSDLFYSLSSGISLSFSLLQNRCITGLLLPPGFTERWAADALPSVILASMSAAFPISLVADIFPFSSSPSLTSYYLIFIIIQPLNFKYMHKNVHPGILIQPVTHLRSETFYASAALLL